LKIVRERSAGFDMDEKSAGFFNAGAAGDESAAPGREEATATAKAITTRLPARRVD
jgi:hypothetical protein